MKNHQKLMKNIKKDLKLSGRKNISTKNDGERQKINEKHKERPNRSGMKNITRNIRKEMMKNDQKRIVQTKND